MAADRQQRQQKSPTSENTWGREVSRCQQRQQKYRHSLTLLTPADAC